MNIAVIGYGSVGQRHEKNLLALRHNVDIFSRHENKSLTKESYDLVIICSKTSEHLKDAKTFSSLSDNFLIEKPLADTHKKALEIKKMLSGKKVRVGYCLIFNPIVEMVKRLISKKVLGDIYFAQIYAGSYLPDWRTGKDYRKRYSAKKTSGGGVALDLIHELNYAQYFFPEKISDVYSYQSKVSHLEITSNDLAHFTIVQKNRYLTITLNYFQLPSERYVKLVGEKGILFADLLDRKIKVFAHDRKKIYSKRFDFDYNQMYIDEIKSMAKFIQGKEDQREILGMGQAITDLAIVEGKIKQ